MKTQRKRKIWLGVGVFMLAGGDTTSAPAFVASAPAMQSFARRSSPYLSPAQHQEHAREAGEAGEAGESKSIANLPPDLAFATRIALLRGHLLIGDELVKQQQWNAALPHFLHPGEEIYGDIKNELAHYGVQPFDAALKALAAVVKSKKGGDAYRGAVQKVNEALAAADAGMKSRQRDNWASFVVEAAVETMKMATGEYQQSLSEGKIAKPVEYQDARGFIWQASAMIESVAPDLGNKDAAALQSVRTGLVELRRAFPTAMPPQMPVRDAGTVIGEVARIELAAGKLM